MNGAHRTAGDGGRAVPGTVWALGFVSLFMDVSSEMIHSLLPVFLVGTLGASAAVLGWIEGLGEATASVLKVFSGWLSDRLGGRRKLLAVVGYGLAAASKPLFPLASGPTAVLVARVADRIGKGIRGAPRDALVADVTPPHALGAAYGLRQALDTVGAFAGPLAAVGLMLLYAGDVRAVFWWALLPAAVAVAVLVVAVKEPARPAAAAALPLRWREAARLGGSFWRVVGFATVFTLARFSEAFLILRAHERGLPLAFAPLVLVVMNLVYALSAAPAGSLSDRIDRRLLLGGSLVVLVAADAALAWWASVAGALLGAALWGLHMGMSQGLLAALVAEAAPAHLRGTAFGLFNLASGAALLVASVVAGWLWEAFGPAATFQAGGAFAVLALLGLVEHRRRGRRARA